MVVSRDRITAAPVLGPGWKSIVETVVGQPEPPYSPSITAESSFWTFPGPRGHECSGTVGYTSDGLPAQYAAIFEARSPDYPWAQVVHEAESIHDLPQINATYIREDGAAWNVQKLPTLAEYWPGAQHVEICHDPPRWGTLLLIHSPTVALGRKVRPLAFYPAPFSAGKTSGPSHIVYTTTEIIDFADLVHDPKVSRFGRLAYRNEALPQKVYALIWQRDDRSPILRTKVSHPVKMDPKGFVLDWTGLPDGPNNEPEEPET